MLPRIIDANLKLCKKKEKINYIDGMFAFYACTDDYRKAKEASVKCLFECCHGICLSSTIGWGWPRC